MNKLHKGEGLNELTLRPIIPNIGTATDEVTKYLNSLLAPLGKWNRNIVNTKTFTNHIKGLKILECYQMFSFDLKSSFTNVPLNEAIDIILRKAHDENKIVSYIPRSILKELLYSCTMHVHCKLIAKFKFSVMSRNILPKLESYPCNRRRYIDNTFAYFLSE